jgi:hypothetical protein
VVTIALGVLGVYAVTTTVSLCSNSNREPLYTTAAIVPLDQCSAGGDQRLVVGGGEWLLGE